MLCVPTAAYAMTTIVPVSDASWLRTLLSIVHYGAAIYLTLINTLAVPRLTSACTRRVGLPRSYLLLLSRLMTTWLVPAVIVVALDNSCGQHWVKFWDMSNSRQRLREMDMYGPNGEVAFTDGPDSSGMTNQTMIDAKRDICLQSTRYDRSNTPQVRE